MQPITALFIGPQGSGKGTQVALLKTYLESHTSLPVFHSDTGNGFRALIKNEGYTNDLVRETINQGALQPVFLPVWIWASAFVEHLTGSEHMLIDGSPRSLVEAQVLESAFDLYKITHPAVVFLNITDEEARTRLLSRGREDDTEEAITTRLALYHEKFDPIESFYRTNDRYITFDINGAQSPEAVHEDIVYALTTRYS